MSLPGAKQNCLCTAVASGDVQAVEKILKSSDKVDINQRSSEGFAPLCIAAFWGYAEIVKLLLDHGADVNVTNKGTGWTPCHCAAFQGHGKALLYLIQHRPDVTIRDSMGRTAGDFGSALDTIWPFFASLGCKRTSKADLIRMDIVKKVNPVESGSKQSDPLSEGGAPLQRMQEMTAHFSRPGSAYIVKVSEVNRNSESTAAVALAYGDVLRDDTENSTKGVNRSSKKGAPQNAEGGVQLNMWRT